MWDVGVECSEVRVLLVETCKCGKVSSEVITFAAAAEHRIINKSIAILGTEIVGIASNVVKRH